MPTSGPVPTSPGGCEGADRLHRAARSTRTAANLVCSQLILLEAEDPSGNVGVHQLAGRLGHRRSGHLRHHAVRAARRPGHVRGPGRLHGAVPPVRRYAGQALRPAPPPDPDAPAARADPGAGGRHRHPGRADHLPEAGDGRAHRLPYRPARRADRGRLRPGPLVQCRGGQAVRLHRRSHPKGHPRRRQGHRGGHRPVGAGSAERIRRWEAGPGRAE